MIKYLLTTIFIIFSSFSFAGSQPSSNLSSCPISNTSDTETWWGLAIGVRNYGCIDNNINVVYSVSIPKACVSGGCGLIIDIHGATMNANDEDKGTKLRWHGWKAQQHFGAKTPYIVIQPNLTDFFDSQGLDLQSVFGDAYLAEMPSMEKFIDDAIVKFNIDKSRIHLTGFSRGTHTVNEFYCDNIKGAKYASFGMHGEKLKCSVKKNRPLLLINGRKDIWTPNQQAYVNRNVMASLRDKGFTETVLHSDPNWTKQVYEWNTGLWRGQHEHRRFTREKGKKFFESIEHSGKSVPLAGHCMPVKNDWGHLACYANFNTGAKLIKFFIAHPKK
jgi:polyhydroxybutyrate depolymerase